MRTPNYMWLPPKTIDIMKDTFIGIIPARYGSTRFPGKALADLGGRPVVRHVYERASAVLPRVVVATDDERILHAVEAFGGEAVMTSPTHRSGTDRCLEAVQRLGAQEDIVINIQGDEPFIDPRQLEALMGCFADPAVDIASLARVFDPAAGFEALADPNTPKVVVDDAMNALYFSRSVIPYVRGASPEEWPAKTRYLTHVGLYAYRRSVLEAIAALPQSSLELAESLEQLRWLQAGLTIRMALTDLPNIGIDTPADLEAAKRLLQC